MIRLPTNNEKVQAILDARKDVAEYLQSIGKIDAFKDFTKDDICGLIRAAQEGVQRSLHEQCRRGFEPIDTSGPMPNDQIPFAPEVRG